MKNPAYSPSSLKNQAGRVRIAQEAGGHAIKPVAAPSPVAAVPAAPRGLAQRPRSEHYALEQRVLFDGAGFAAIDMQMDGPEQQLREAQRIAAEQVRALQERESSREVGAALPIQSTGKTVVVIDARVTNYQDLIKDMDPNAVLRVIRAGEDGVAVISKLLGDTGNVSSLQIVSHGSAGSIRLGTAVLDSNALANTSTAAELASWSGSMTANADILILGCDVAQGDKGQDFVQKLADLTRADISASVDDTGAAAKGGNWVLEFNVGQVESFYAFSEASMRNYDRVLPAGPASALTVPATTLMGSTGNKASVTFDNTGTVGYAPYIVVGFDRTGADGSPNAVPSEGAEYKLGSAKLNSGTLASERIVNNIPAGNFTVVGLVDGMGTPIVFNAADYGLSAGDQLVIWQLPFGSFTPDQPAARIDFEYNVGNNADSGNTVAQGGQGAGKELVIASKAIFAFGNSPAGGAAIVEAAAASAPTNPQWYTTQYINTSRELEQVPGSNDKQQFQAVLNIAPDQAILSGAGITNTLNPGATTDRYISRLDVPQVTIGGIPTTAASFQTTDIKLTQGPGLGAAPIAGATEYFVVDKVSGAPASQNPDGSWSSPGGVQIIAIAAQNTRITGSPTLNFEYFIIDRVIDPITGADVPQTFDAKHTGTVDFNDGDDANAAFTIDPPAVQIEYETIQIQKSVAGPYADVLAIPLGDNGVNPNAVRSGDTLTYTLTIQISDFYGLRGAVVTDVLPDGVDFNVGSMKVTGANVNGQAFTPITNAGSFMTDAGGTLGTYTVARQADEGGGTVTVGGGGKQALQLNLSAALAANGITNTGIGGANSGDLLGDKFGTALGQGLTTVTITYTATVRDTYRDVANGNLSSGTQNLLENDVLKNDVRVHGNLLTNTGGAINAAAAITSGVINADESSASVTIKDGALLLQVYAINGDTTFPKQGGKALIAPGDNVTYRIRYDLAQGDYNNLKLSTFLPDPIFKATDMNADGNATGTAEMTRIAIGARDNLNGSIGSTANWAQAGAYTLGPVHNNSSAGTGGITDTPLLSSLAVNDATAGNRIEFTIGDSSRTTNPGGSNNAHTSLASEKIDILFTVKAQDGTNFADDLLLTAQGNEISERSVNGGVTEATPLPDDRIIQLKLIAPTLSVKHGLIATGGTGGAAGDQNGVVSTLALPSGAVVKAAGDGSAGVAITGLSATNAITSGAALDTNIAKVDAGDTVRGALSIVNESRAGAYDVRTTAITPPPGYRFASDNTTLDSAANNVRVMRGDGTLLVVGTDYNFVGNKIEFVDKDRVVPLGNDENGIPAFRALDGKGDPVLLAGKDGDGNLRTDGQNVIIITYDMVVDNDGLANATNNSVAASSTTSTIGIDQYAASNGFGGTANILSAPLTDTATSTIEAPQADIRWAGDATTTDKTPTAADTTATQTTAGNAVIGEAAFFDVLITIPEGDTKAFSADINLPPGLKLDPAFTPVLFTTVGSDANDAQTSQIASNWTGTAPVVQGAPVGINSVTGAVAGTIGDPGVGMRLNFGDLSNPQDNTKTNNQFVVRVRAIVANTSAADSTSPATNNQAHNPSSGIAAEPDGAKGNQAGILRTTTSSSNYRSGADPVLGTGGAVVNIDDTTTANDPTITIVEPTVTTVVTAKVVDIDPVMGGDQVSPANEADENDIVEYTITLTNPTSGSINAYDLKFAQALPPEVDQTGPGLGIVSATRGLTSDLDSNAATGFNGSGVAVTAGQFELVGGNTVQTKGGAAGDAASNLDLAPGETIVLKVRARVNASAAANPSFSSTATTQWTSIDSANNLAASQDANERTGADGLLQGALTGVQADLGTGTTSGTGANQANTTNGTNDYRTASRGDVNVVAIEPVLSRIGGLSDTSSLANNAAGNSKDGSPSDGKDAQNMAVGEITRFRMVVKVPAGTTPGFVIQPTLPAGYTYLGNATVGLVSDTPMTSSTVGIAAGLTMGDGTGVVSTGDAAAWGNIQNDLSAPTYGATDPRAVGTNPVVAITANTATAGGTTASPRFELGNLSNTDNDTDNEYVVIEFNAVVNNAAANQSGTNLDTNFKVLSNSGAGEVVRATSNTTRDKVVEPDIPAVAKDVIDVQRAAGNTSTAQGAVENTITAKSSFTVSNAANTTAAYNVVLADGFPDAAGANDLAVNSVKIGATTYVIGTDALPAGAVLVTTATGYTLTIDKLDPGTVVEVIYKVDVPVATSVASSPTTNNATVTWSGLPDAASWAAGTNVFAGATLGADGTPTGERDGTGGLASVPTNIADQTGPLNNYQVKDSAGYSTITGTLWDDTKAADGTIGTVGDEKRLNGVTVSLNWAGADGVFGNTDDRTITTTTDASGLYSFGALPVGNYKITASTSVSRSDSNDAGNETESLAVRFDRTDGTTGGLNVAALTITEGSSTTTRDFGYVQPNDPPVNSIGGSNTFPTTPLAASEDTTLLFTGTKQLAIADPDGNQGDGILQTTLTLGSAAAGTLTATNGGGGATVVGTGSQTITITGTKAQINTALATLEYAPTTNFNGDTTVTMVTNDRGQGGDADGDLDPHETGGINSQDKLTDADVINITVAAVNDAPIATGSATMPTTVEDTANPTGTPISTMFAANYSDPADVVVGGSSANTLAGIAITNNPATAAQGKWQYSPDGTTWTDVPTSVSETNALVLPVGHQLRFLPDPDYNTNSTTPAPALTTRLIDNSGGAIASAATGQDVSTNGGTTAISAGTVLVNTAVTPINDAPLFAATTTTILGTTPEDTPSTATSVLIAFPSFTDPKDIGEANGIDARVGVLITGNTASVAEGNWQYSPDGGTTWVDVPRTISDTTAIYLPDATVLRFNPAADFVGTPGKLTARLVENDQTTTATASPDLPANGTGTAFFDVTNTPTTIRTGIDLPASGGVGGTSRVSANTRDVEISIVPANDRPVVSGTATDFSSMAEGTANSSVRTVTQVFGSLFTDPVDAAQPNTADTMIGVLVTGTAANPTTEGAWEYSTNGGTTWTAVPTTTSDSAAIYLPNAAQLRFTPVDANYSGTPGKLTVRLVENDQTLGGAIFPDVPNGAANGTTIGNSIDSLLPGATVNITSPVGNAAQFATGRVSETTQVGIVVTPVSDAPLLTIGTPAGNEPGANAGTTGNETSPPAATTGNNATATVTGSIKGLEDQPIPLGISVATADSTTGAMGSTETPGTTVTISGIPAGWVIKDGAGATIPQPTAGTATLTTAQLVNATITAPTDKNSVGPAGTTPAATLTVTATSADGTAAAATTTGTLNVVVVPVNDRPVAIDDTVDVVVAATAEGNLNAGGETVASLFTPRFTDPKDTGEPNGADTMIGVVITGTAANPSTEGTWQYSTNNGTSWTSVPVATSDASAIYLSSTAIGAATNLVRFVPVDANYSGTPGKLTVRLVENDQTPAGVIIADVPNGAANATTIGTGGLNTTPGATSDISAPVGGAAFPLGQVSNPITVVTSVTPVSDAPRLTIGTPAGDEPGVNVGTTGNETSPPAATTGNNATATVTGSIKGLEDQPIPLGISVATADTSTGTAGSTETTSTTVTISAIPVGWVIKDGAGNVIPQTAGAATLTTAQLVNATITAPTDKNSTGPAGTTPAATLTVTATSQDGTAAAATTTGTLNVVVVPVNDRPVAIDDTVDVVVAATAEGNLNAGGETVFSLFNPRFTDPKDTGEPNGADTMIGVVITGTAANPTTEGTWQYSTNNGTSWTSVPVATSDATAIYLSSTATGATTNLVRFVPVDANYSGTPGKLTVRLVENDQTPAGVIIADVPNGAANATTIGTGGLNTTPGATSDISAPVGGAAFPLGQVSNPITVVTSVTPVSDAPRLTIGTPAGEEALAPTTTGQETSPPAAATGNNATATVTGSIKGLEDQPIPLGISVATADTTTGTAGSTEITGTTVTISAIPVGWVIKDGAGNVIPQTAGAATLTTAQLVNATITAPTDKNSTGPAGTTPAATLTVTATSADGTAAAATTTGTLNVVVVPVNDAPAFVATTPTVLPATLEETPSSGVPVSTAFPGYSDPKDVGEPNGGDARVGVVITKNAATPAQGNWQYSPDGGTTWVDVPRDISDTTAIYLPDTTLVRFNPALNFNGTPGNLTSRLVENDQTAAGVINPDLPANATGTGFFSGANTPTTIRTGINLPTDGGVGGTSRISDNTRDVAITITPVNDTPAVVAPTAVLPVGDVPIVFKGTNAIVLSDAADFPANDGPVVTVTITPTGNGRPFLSALTPGVTQVSGPPVGSLPAANGTPIVLTGTLADINKTLENLEYRSRQFYNGADSFTVQINDNANGGPGPLLATTTVLIDNTPLNDRPVVAGVAEPNYANQLPGGTTDGRTVQELFGKRFTDPRDDPTTNGGDVFAGVAVIGTPPASQGVYEFSPDGGKTWVKIAPDTSAANAVILQPNALVRFVVNPSFTGDTTPLKAVLIETDQVAPKQGDLLNRAGVPLDTATSGVPPSGTILDLSKLEAAESQLVNKIGRSRFSNIGTPMEVGVKVEPATVASPVVPIAAAATGTTLSALSAPTPTPATFVGTTLQGVQAEALQASEALDQQFAQGLGNSGLQPNWLAPNGVPGIDPFAAPLPDLQVRQAPPPPPPPPPFVVAEAPPPPKPAIDPECAKPPRVVAKPRAPGEAPKPPRFAPGSPAAKRFSEQLKLARARARC